MFEDIHTQIIGPLLEACGLEKEDQARLSVIIYQVIIMNLILKILEYLPEEKKREVESMLAKAKDDNEKLKILTDALVDSPQTKKAIESYIQNDLFKFLKEMINAFLKNATPEQEKRFLDLLKNTPSVSHKTP
uniref:Uncharacterized protein n=1 Tax=candidate division CPR3 bacterium TaxID=2268181 RepID=A0A7C5USR3_UNCC3